MPTRNVNLTESFRIAAGLSGLQYGFPRSRVGLGWEPLFIQARSASKGIRAACTSRAEQEWDGSDFRRVRNDCRR